VWGRSRSNFNEDILIHSLMKNYYSAFLLIFVTAHCFGQVGIGTTSPDATLHIAGDQSTVRIEALNVENNPLNDGDKLAPTYIQKNGEITLTPSEVITESIHIIDASPTFSANVVATNNSAPSTVTNIYNYQIT